MIRAILTEENFVDQRQKSLEREARRLASAWSDFDTVEQLANEVIRRFGAIEPRDLGVLRLHKDPIFTALQTACVVGYVRPFLAGLERLNADYGTYSKSEWQNLHEDMFVWKERFAGDGSLVFRQYVVAPDMENKGEFVIGEASPVLSPRTEFKLLREMCTDRKVKLWPALQDALSQCYPVLYHPVLLSRNGNTSL